MNPIEDSQKPKDPGGFAKPVAWLFGRQLIASLKEIALYAAFKGKLDPRDWMNSEILAFETYPETPEEFWLDYISDSGDGQKAVYSLAYLCLSSLRLALPSDWDRLEDDVISHRLKDAVFLKRNEAAPQGFESHSLPRGRFLFAGGDTGYHIADYTTLAERFQKPFRWAFADLLENGELESQNIPRAILGVPGNHDYYDALDGFNRQFKKPVDVSGSDRTPCLEIPTFERVQEATYSALKLPFGWWFLGIDTKDGDLDFRQKEFFRQIISTQKPDKLIVATPEPTTVVGRQATVKEQVAFREIGLPLSFLEGDLPADQIRLDLSGDVHHYERYWGPASRKDVPAAPNYASVVSGMGGAFLHPSHTDFGKMKAQSIYPKPMASRQIFARHIFNYWNVMRGGYVWLFGAVLSFIFYLGASSPDSVSAMDQLQRIWMTVQPASRVWLAWFVLYALSLVILIPRVSMLHKDVPITTESHEIQAKRLKRQLILFRIAALLSTAIAIYSVYKLCMHTFLSFSAAPIIFLAAVHAVVLISGSGGYSKALFQLTYHASVRSKHYIPVIVIVAAACLEMVLVVRFAGDSLPAPDLAFKLLFFSVAVGISIGLPFLGFSVGGEGQTLGYRLLFLAFGFWHAILQLAVPYLISVQGSIGIAVLELLLLAASSLIGRTVASYRFRWPVAVAWFCIGLLAILIPFWVKPFWRIDFRDTYHSLHSSSVSRFLVADFLRGIPAALLGIIYSCAWFSWYLAVSLAFNGHNNEAGGAGRVEEYKEFIRIRLTRNDLTAFIIGFDQPQIHGKDLDVKLIDFFRLRRK